jgi:hypothetical protein
VSRQLMRFFPRGVKEVTTEPQNIWHFDRQTPLKMLALTCFF